VCPWPKDLVGAAKHGAVHCFLWGEPALEGSACPAGGRCLAGAAGAAVNAIARCKHLRTGELWSGGRCGLGFWLCDWGPVEGHRSIDKHLNPRFILARCT
jgi:hypothetical protein